MNNLSIGEKSVGLNKSISELNYGKYIELIGSPYPNIFNYKAL